MKPTNLLYIISDQHNRSVMGCSGNSVARTPNLDRLAEGGTRFTRAYTNCPICVPARASLATGRYVHQIGFWDNGFPYDGSVPGWGHRLKEEGVRVDSIGKLHFRSADDDNGFTQEVDPLHVVEGTGDILGCVRDNPPFRKKRPGIEEEAGPGDSTYLRYDVSNADAARRWLGDHANDEKPWVLFLSLVCPHPPYISPPDLFEHFDPETMPMPPQWRQEEWPDHPAMDYFRRYFDFTEPFSEPVVRNMIRAYYGVTEFLDGQIGSVLDAMRGVGLVDSTRVLYTSDHGECMGARGIFGKFTMYEESAGVPLILSGPDVPEGGEVATPVSLVDSHPTILESVGIETDEERPGRSLWQMAQQPDRDRTVFSEYHALGTTDGYYMLTDARYIYYIEAPAQLFDLATDPGETTNLASAGEHASITEEFEGRLRAILDPEAVDAQAKADQRAKVAEHGGVEALAQKGSFVNSPVPGEKPAFRSYK